MQFLGKLGSLNLASFETCIIRRIRHFWGFLRKSQVPICGDVPLSSSLVAPSPLPISSVLSGPFRPPQFYPVLPGPSPVLPSPSQSFPGKYRYEHVVGETRDCDWRRGRIRGALDVDMVPRVYGLMGSFHGQLMTVLHRTGYHGSRRDRLDVWERPSALGHFL